MHVMAESEKKFDNHVFKMQQKAVYVMLLLKRHKNEQTPNVVSVLFLDASILFPLSWFLCVLGALQTEVVIYFPNDLVFNMLTMAESEICICM